MGDQSRAFGSMDSGFSYPKIEQSRGFGSLDSGFSHSIPSHIPNQIPNQNYNMQQTSGYSVPQTFSTAPPVSGYSTSNMLGVSESGFGFDQMAVNGGQNYPQVPMSRAHGSASSYGHSPQHAPDALLWSPMMICYDLRLYAWAFGGWIFSFLLRWSGFLTLVFLFFSPL